MSTVSYLVSPSQEAGPSSEASFERIIRRRLDRRVRADAEGRSSRTFPPGALLRDAPEGRRRIVQVLARFAAATGASAE